MKVGHQLCEQVLKHVQGCSELACGHAKLPRARLSHDVIHRRQGADDIAMPADEKLRLSVRKVRLPELKMFRLVLREESLLLGDQRIHVRDEGSKVVFHAA